MYFEKLKSLGSELDKSSMKQIIGGYGGSGCGYITRYPDGSTFVIFGVSQNWAIWGTNQGTGHGN